MTNQEILGFHPYLLKFGLASSPQDACKQKLLNHGVSFCSDVGARLLPQVERIVTELEQLAGGNSGEGMSGMVTKLKAAKLTSASGMAMVIADGREPEVILRVVAGELLGTFFLLPAVSRLESRKWWMLSPNKQLENILVF